MLYLRLTLLVFLAEALPRSLSGTAMHQQIREGWQRKPATWEQLVSLIKAAEDGTLVTTPELFSMSLLRLSWMRYCLLMVTGHGTTLQLI